MDTSETYIKMCEKAGEIQEALGKYDGHLEPPDDGIYHRRDPYPVAVIYESRLICSSCKRGLDTAYCSEDGGKAVASGEFCLQFGGPCSKDLKECKIVWLPRQDQLQEMMPTGENLEAFEVGHANQIRYQLEAFCHDSKLDYTNQFSSMEQLWLAFVMKEKYNKTWDGEDWASA